MVNNAMCSGSSSPSNRSLRRRYAFRRMSDLTESVNLYGHSTARADCPECSKNIATLARPRAPALTLIRDHRGAYLRATERHARQTHTGCMYPPQCRGVASSPSRPICGAEHASRNARNIMQRISVGRRAIGCAEFCNCRRRRPARQMTLAAPCERRSQEDMTGTPAV